MFTSIWILGAGGEAKEVLSLIQQINKKRLLPKYIVRAFITDKAPYCSPYTESFIRSEKQLEHHINTHKETVSLVLGIGNPMVREKVFTKFVKYSNVRFPNIIAPTAEFGYGVSLTSANVVKSGVKITCDVNIGCGNLFNRDVNVGHDCKIGDFNVINPGAIISGNCNVGNANLIGTNSTIIEKNDIGDGTRVGAGAVVTRRVFNGKTVTGVPARAWE